MLSHKISMIFLVANLVVSGAVFAAAGKDDNAGDSAAVSERKVIDGYGFRDGAITPESARKAMTKLAKYEALSVALRDKMGELESMRQACDGLHAQLEAQTKAAVQAKDENVELRASKQRAEDALLAAGLSATTTAASLSASTRSLSPAPARKTSLYDQARRYDKANPKAKYLVSGGLAILAVTEARGTTGLVRGLVALTKDASRGLGSAFSALSAGGDQAHIRMTPPCSRI